MFEKHKFIQDHEDDVKNILLHFGCLDNKNRLRRIVPGVWKMLKEMGHTSFDYEKCDCCKKPFSPWHVG